MIVGVLPYMSVGTKLLVFIGLCAFISFFCQFGYLVMLQSITCGGMKDYGTVASGAALSALITGAMIAVPTYIESMRLIISNLISPHKSLLTKDLSIVNDSLIATAGSINQHAGSINQHGGAMTPEEYEVQTFNEIVIGSCYWGAFAGAYGVGIGSLFATKCPVTVP